MKASRRTLIDGGLFYKLSQVCYKDVQNRKKPKRFSIIYMNEIVGIIPGEEIYHSKFF